MKLMTTFDDYPDFDRVNNKSDYFLSQSSNLLIQTKTIESKTRGQIKMPK